ncbi:hypothetical protein BH23CHL3_BH23CHL3_06470 [soil metagenome]
MPIVGWWAFVLQHVPAGVRRHPEQPLGDIFVLVLGIGALVRFRLEVAVSLIEGVGDVLEEDQPQNDVLVFGGVHVTAERISSPPQLGLFGAGQALRTRHWPGFHDITSVFQMISIQYGQFPICGPLMSANIPLYTKPGRPGSIERAVITAKSKKAVTGQVVCIERFS